MFVEKLRPEELKKALEHTFRPSLRAHTEWGKGTRADCRLQWAMGHSYFESLRLSKYSDISSFEEAKAAYTQAAVILRERLQLKDRQDDDVHQAFKIEMNTLAMLLNMCDRQTRAHSVKVRDWLTGSEFLPKALAAVDVEPWNLGLMHQALVGAAILQKEEDARGLVCKIKALCAKFFEEGVAPLPGLEPARLNPDLSWIFKHELHLATACFDEGDDIESEENDHDE